MSVLCIDKTLIDCTRTLGRELDRHPHILERAKIF
jgi:hypothetical protein